MHTMQDQDYDVHDRDRSEQHSVLAPVISRAYGFLIYTRSGGLQDDQF
jgi:hypothetical protein